MRNASQRQLRKAFRLFTHVLSDTFTVRPQGRPTKVIACVGLGLCLARHHLHPEGVVVAVRRRGKITARFDGALPTWGISELKSNAVGKRSR